LILYQLNDTIRTVKEEHLHRLSGVNAQGGTSHGTGRLDRPRRQVSPERWQRAPERALFAGVDAKQLAGTGQWIVSSASRPGLAYQTDGISCGCEAAMLGGDPVCLHRAAKWNGSLAGAHVLTGSPLVKLENETTGPDPLPLLQVLLSGGRA
jgi:hypothetical protein